MAGLYDYTKARLHLRKDLNHEKKVVPMEQVRTTPTVYPYAFGPGPSRMRPDSAAHSPLGACPVVRKTANRSCLRDEYESKYAHEECGYAHWKDRLRWRR